MIKLRYFGKKIPNVQYKIIKTNQEETDYNPFECELREEDKPKKEIISIDEIIGSEPVQKKEDKIDYPFEEVITTVKKEWTPFEHEEIIQKKKNTSIYSDIFEEEPVLVKKK